MQTFKAFVSTIFAVITISLYGQQSLDFDVQQIACINERLQLSVNNATQQQIAWDFCGNQLEGTYSAVNRGTIVAQLTDIKIVEDNNHWFGFAVSRTNQLLRLDFGNNPANAPISIVSLGNPDNSIFSPEGIDIIKEGNTWYGLVTNQGNEITRLTWVGSLMNTPSGTRLNLASFNKLNVPIEVEILHDNNQYVAVVTNSADNRVTLINFGNSLSNSPIGSDMKMSAPFPAGPLIYGVTSAKVCNDWTLYVIAGDRLYRVTLSDSLFDDIQPGQIVDITNDLPISIGLYNHVRALVEGTDVHIFFSSYTGVQVQSVIWRAGATHAVFNDLHLPSFNYNPYGFDVYDNNGEYGLLITGYDAGSLTQVTAVAPCNVNRRLSNEINPESYYTQAGDYEVILKTLHTDGTICASTQTVTVTQNVAPSVLINFNDVKCVGTTVLFHASGDLPNINSFDWDFGDATNSVVANPSHEYVNPGIFPLRLSITGNNACANFSLDTVQIYAKPVPLFTGPTGIVCTNNELKFENQTVDEFDSHLQYEWLVNDVSQSGARDFSLTLSTPGSLNIKLRTSIPGCTTQAETQYANVEEGPLVSFTSAGKCQSEIISFVNTTSGSVSGYLWNFGDGQTSTTVNPAITFANPGVFNTVLIASNAAGCNNTFTKPVTVYSAPQVNFAALAPPFSCSGTTTQFNDLTPPPSDSNLSSWLWDFDDAGSPSNTSTQKNAQHMYATAGDYYVSLTVTSNFSCSTILQKVVTIYQTPTIDFTHSALCEDSGVTFSDATPGHSAWNWQIGSSFYTTENATHIFSNPGTYNVTLSATASNNCIGATTKPVTIAPKLAVDFSSAKTCVNQDTQFTNLTDDATDPITAVQWNFGGLGTSLSDPATFRFVDIGTANVTLTVTTTSGCQYPITKAIGITSGPLAAFTADPNLGEAPLVVSFTNTSLNANSFTWRFGDSAESTSIVQSPSFTYTTAGDYTVTLIATDVNNCADTTRQLIQASQLPEVNNPYPNPGTGKFFIEWNTSKATPTVVAITDATGRQIREFEIAAEAGRNRCVLDITGEQPGLYILTIRYLKNLKTYRLMVAE